MSLFGKDATSFSHLDLGILCHSSLQILSSSVRLDGKRWWTAIFRSLQRCSIGFKSGLWLGHSRTVTELLWSHSFVILAVCLGSLSCWKVNLRPSLRSWALWRRFSSRISSGVVEGIRRYTAYTHFFISRHSVYPLLNPLWCVLY